MSPPISPWTKCTLKWYDAGMGYGFLELENGSKDIMLHVNIVRKSGFLGRFLPGTTLECQYVPTPKGLQAIDIRELE